MTKWMWIYNHECPHMALGGITPKQKQALLNKLYFGPQLKMGGLPKHQ
jgi:hypothetical protein